MKRLELDYLQPSLQEMSVPCLDGSLHLLAYSRLSTLPPNALFHQTNNPRLDNNDDKINTPPIMPRQQLKNIFFISYFKHIYRFIIGADLSQTGLTLKASATRVNERSHSMILSPCILKNLFINQLYKHFIKPTLFISPTSLCCRPLSAMRLL